MKSRIQMSNGKFFYFDNPEAAEYDIFVLAHALSNICRFTGHCRRHYSVAQHSVLLSRQVHRTNPEDAFAGLIHDATEAFTNDFSAPLKHWLRQHCPAFDELEKRIHAAVCTKFGIPPEIPPAVKIMDMRMLATERRDLMVDSEEPWESISGVQPLDDKIKVWSQEEAARTFVDRFFILAPGLDAETRKSGRIAANIGTYWIDRAA